MFGSADENRRPPFEVTPTERKMWEDWAQASIAPDPQQALQDWARRYKIKLTNQTVMSVTRAGSGGEFLPPVLELGSVMLERGFANGALLPIEEDLELGEAVEAAQSCKDYCAASFETSQEIKSPGGVINVSTHCKYKTCKTKVVNGKKVYICLYDCTASATTKA